jgi:hypothetical protein
MNDLPPDSRPVPTPDPDQHPTQAIPAQQSPDAAAQTPVPGPAPAKERLRDRLWSLRAVIAVALASVIVGGLGGAALANVSQGNDGRMGPGRFQRGGPGGPPGMMNGGPGQRNGHQLPDRRGFGHRDQRDGQPARPGEPLPTAPSPTLPEQSD